MESREHLYDHETEKSLLGEAINFPAVLDAVRDLVGPEDFHVDRHRVAWSALEELSADNEPIDLLTVREKLQQEGLLDRAGGFDYLVNLPDISGSNAPYHARRIRDLGVKRRVWDAIRQEGGPDRSETAEEYTERLQGTIAAITEGRGRNTMTVLDELLDRSMQRKKQGEVRGWETSLTALHQIVPKFRAGEIIVIAGRPGHGKSTLARRIVRDLATQGSVAVFSLEETGESWADGLLSQESGIHRSKIVDGQMAQEEWREVEQARESIRGLPVWVEESSAITPGRIVSRSRMLGRMTGDLTAIVVDYVQLLHDPNSDYRGNRNLEIGAFGARFKSLAKELEIPVFVLSQLSKSCERRSDKRPILSDLRDSGTIEQDAHTVIALYRHQAYYRDAQWARNLGEAIVLKQRIGGRTGGAILGHRNGFYDLDQRGESWKRERYQRGLQGAAGGSS